MGKSGGAGRGTHDIVVKCSCAATEEHKPQTRRCFQEMMQPRIVLSLSSVSDNKDISFHFVLDLMGSWIEVTAISELP